ncbi:MAG TPA: DinB family protein [Gemmatimonadales bacterium]
MTSLVGSIGTTLLRELVSLRKEVEAYPSDADLWRVPPGVSNSGGTLAIHLTGNLQHFIGAVLGKTGYVRDRDAEFAIRGLSRSEVLDRIDQTTAALARTFSSLTDDVLGSRYPEPVAKVRVLTGDFLVHLQSHLAYHLGQIDYHRRITTGTGPLPGSLSPARLGSAETLE